MKAFRWFTRSRVAVAATLGGVIVVSGGAYLMAGEPDGYAGPNPEVLAAKRAGAMVPGSLEQVRDVPDPAHELTWQVWRYATDVYHACYEAVAIGEGRSYLGFVGGCGSTDRFNTDPYYFTGWVQALGGEPAFVSFGVIPGAKGVVVNRVVWERIGSSQRMNDAPVEGVWAFVTDGSIDARVKLLDFAQTVQGSHRITPIEEVSR